MISTGWDGAELFEKYYFGNEFFVLVMSTFDLWARSVN